MTDQSKSLGKKTVRERVERHMRQALAAGLALSATAASAQTGHPLPVIDPVPPPWRSKPPLPVIDPVPPPWRSKPPLPVIDPVPPPIRLEPQPPIEPVTPSPKIPSSPPEEQKDSPGGSSDK
jgi:hypothetical protein